MDPNATLAELHDVFAAAADVDTDLDTVGFAYLRAAELFTALDEWLTKGGFLPDAWATAPYAR